jgi:hypothetical protein
MSDVKALPAQEMGVVCKQTIWLMMMAYLRGLQMITSKDMRMERVHSAIPVVTKKI